jgi:hypothetical protein
MLQTSIVAYSPREKEGTILKHSYARDKDSIKLVHVVHHKILESSQRPLPKKTQKLLISKTLNQIRILQQNVLKKIAFPFGDQLPIREYLHNHLIFR